MKNPLTPCFRHINKVCSRFRGNRQTDRKNDYYNPVAMRRRVNSRMESPKFQIFCLHLCCAYSNLNMPTTGTCMCGVLCSVSSRIELKQGGSGVNVTTWDVYSHEEGMINFCLLDFKNYNVHLQGKVTACVQVQ